jgi:hypothetical protein
MTRIAVVLVSLAAAGWLANAYPGTRAEEQAREIQPAAGEALTPAQLRRSIELLQDARRGRPDGDIIPRLAGLELTAGNTDAAVALVRPLVAREPENVTAWAVLALALQSTDPAAAEQAQSRRRELAPPVEP